MTTVADIEGEVFKVPRTSTPRGTIIKGDQRLIADLRLLSDDATTMIVDLERKYRIRLPQAEWGNVLTVQDTIDLLARHLAPDERKP